MKQSISNQKKGGESHQNFILSTRSLTLLAILLIFFQFFNLSCTDQTTELMESPITSLLASSSDNDSTLYFDDEESAILYYLDDDYTFLEEEARKYALNIADEFASVDGIQRTIKSLKVINLPKGYKLSDSIDFAKQDEVPELYIYDFSPKGFAIISGDERSLGHIGSSMEAHLNEGDFHNGYKWLLNTAIAYIFNKRIAHNHKIDSVLKTPVYARVEQKVNALQKQEASKDTNTHIAHYYSSQCYGRTVVVQTDWGVVSNRSTSTPLGDLYYFHQAGPLLRTDFYQGPPYNNNYPDGGCGNTTNGKYVAGCVPIAYAQLFIYFNLRTGHESNFMRGQINDLYNHHYVNDGNWVTRDERTYNNPSLDNAAAFLVRTIYNRFNTDKYQGCTATGVHDEGFLSSNFVRQSYGFKQNHSYTNYDYWKIFNSIYYRRSPVMIKGYHATAGHQWLIDGVRSAIKRYQVNRDVRIKYRVGNKCLTTGKISYFTYGYRIERSIKETSVREYEVHHNWGWNNSNGDSSRYKSSDWTNGFFTYSFNSGNGVFKYRTQIITDMERR